MRGGFKRDFKGYFWFGVKVKRGLLKWQGNGRKEWVKGSDDDGDDGYVEEC